MRHSLAFSALRALVGVLCSTICGAVASEPSKTELFTSGADGYHTYRIPALVTTNDGTILAFCEGRKTSPSDSGDIDLVLKRSFDGGRSWTAAQIVADDAAHTMGNPCPVVERSTGTIFLPFCRDNRQVLLMRSTDDGQTFSAPVDISTHAMNPNWHYVGTGPGHGIQLTSGRLLIPCWADFTPRLGEIQFSYVFYSDDRGAGWKLGEPLDRNASDECEAVELMDGTLYMNMRSRQGKKQRAYARSTDGGRSWTPVEYDRDLPEPSCQGSLVRLTDTTGFEKSRVLLATPGDPNVRTHLTVRVSYDECRTWPVSKVLHPGSSAYSDLAVTDDYQVLCSYEADGYSKIVLARFDIGWLTDGKDALRRKER
ncbi:MAG: sialidase family protein [Planctomycetota bacterium]